MEPFVPTCHGCKILRCRNAENTSEIQYQNAQYVLQFTGSKQFSQLRITIQVFLAGISVLIHESSVLQIDSASQGLKLIITRIYDEFQNSPLHSQTMIQFLKEIHKIKKLQGNIVSYISKLQILILNNDGFQKLLEQFFQSVTIAQEYEQYIKRNDFIRKQIQQIREQKCSETFLETYQGMVKASIVLDMKMLLIQNNKTSHPTKDPKTNNNGENDIKLKFLYPVSGLQLLLFGEDSLESTTQLIKNKQDDTQTTTCSMNKDFNQNANVPFTQYLAQPQYIYRQNPNYKVNLLLPQNSQLLQQRQEEQIMPSFIVTPKVLQDTSSVKDNYFQNAPFQMYNAELILPQQFQQQNLQYPQYSFNKTHYQSNERPDAINGYYNRGGMIERVKTDNGEQNHQPSQDTVNESKKSENQEMNKIEKHSVNNEEEGKSPKQGLNRVPQGVQSQEQTQNLIRKNANEEGTKVNKESHAKNKKLKAVRGQIINNSIVFQNFGNNNKFVQHYPPLLNKSRRNQSQNLSNSSQNGNSDDDDQSQD